MLKRWMSLGLAAAMAVTITGCYRAVDTAQDANLPIEADEVIAAGQRHFNQARVTTTKLESQIASKDWEGAADSVVAVRHHLETLASSRKIDPQVKAHVRQLMPTVYALHARVAAREADSLPLTRNLKTQFDETARALVGLGFLATQGGGAGTGDDMTLPIVPDDELNEDLETPTNIEE